jgi:hypothetical protein
MIVFTVWLWLAASPHAAVLPALDRPARSGQAASSSGDELIADLAGRIAAALAGIDGVRLVIVDEAAPQLSNGPRLERDLAEQLAARGVRVVDNASGSAVVRVACSANLRERVCAAEIKTRDSSQTLIASSPLDRSSDAHDAESLTLDLHHVFGQREPILDIAAVGDRLIVLDSTSLSLYQRAGTTWERRRSQPIVTSRVWPRDLRGRLRVSGGSVDAFLPAVVCRAALDSFTMSCVDERQPWPLPIENAGIAGGRNYFTTPEGVAFYGFAALDGDAGARWLLAADRSRLLLADEARRPIEPAIGAADDVAGVAGCLPGALVLAASRGSAAEGGDIVGLFRVRDRHLVPVASPLLLPGSLTALWAAAGSSSATAVVRRTTQNGKERYDAFQVDVVCSR